MTKLAWLKRHLALPLGLTAAVVLASCGQSDSPAAAPPTAAPQESHGNATAGPTSTSKTTTSPAGTSPSTPEGRRVEITVKGKQVIPGPHSVPIKVGESLTIAVTSDHDDQLHAHGFKIEGVEIEKDIKAGQPLVFTVKGTKTGLFEVELHHPPLRILQIKVS
jgi:hypothetical protein